MSERHEATFTVPASHPSLPGHFPGAPVVPGVVVLDLVLRAASEWQQRVVSVSGLKQVKFLAPLLPEERADVALEINGDALGFRVARGEQVIAQGTFVLAAGSRDSAAPSQSPESASAPESPRHT
jgi:3-hydroxymyristoyl/3-hydroxydecanoyl-(acyl carrier protein) dehydratase